MFSRTTRTSLATAVMAVLIAGLLGFNPINAADDKSETKPQPIAYPLDYCLVSGQKLGSMGEPPVIEFEGREIKFCCGGCIDEFKTHAATYLGKLDSAMITRQMAYYPLQTCVVGGGKLDGKKSQPINIVYDNRLVRFGSEASAKQFAEDPAPYLAKLDQAVVETQLADYPLTTCPVSGKELGGMGEPVNYVYGNRLVRLCCGGCIDTFRSDPTAYLAKIDAARESQKKTGK